MSTKTNTHKDDRIDLRVKRSQKDFLNYAASMHNMKLSAFVLYGAVKTAEETVAEKIHFSLSKKQWNSFCEALDKPARVIPKLKKLFKEPDIFDE